VLLVLRLLVKLGLETTRRPPERQVNPTLDEVPLDRHRHGVLTTIAVNGDRAREHRQLRLLARIKVPSGVEHPEGVVVPPESTEVL
jgi:hypothetical protein